MRSRFWGCLAVAAFCLTGCTGFWDAPASSGGGGTGSTTLSSGDVYVLNVATSQMVGLYVNAGALTVLPGSPYTLSAAPIAITVAPNNAFLYVSTLGGIFVYNVNTSTGELTVGNSGQPISSDPATSMQVDSTNTWLVEGVSGTSNLFAIHVNATTGLLASNTEQTAVLPATSLEQVAVSPDDSSVLAAMGSGGTAIVGFNPNNANPFGTVGTIGVKNANGAALSVAFDPGPSGSTVPRLFYIGETVATSGSNTGGLRVVNFSTRQEISGSPYAIGGLAPYSILPLSTGDYVYVVSRQTSSGSTGVIAGFSITSANSAFTLTALGSTFATGTNPQALVEDNTQAFVFAADFGGSPDLIGYVFDTTNAGYLDKVISNATGTDPVQASAVAALH
ncbi:MAG: beta-propeller fold lactonase family protein [Terracidiphilus sp.]